MKDLFFLVILFNFTGLNFSFLLQKKCATCVRRFTSIEDSFTYKAYSPFPFNKDNSMDREASFKLLKKQMISQYKLSGYKISKRENYIVVYASGLAGIGKSTFGEQALANMAMPDADHDNSNSDSANNFQKVLSKMKYLCIEMNGKGDSFCEMDYSISAEESMALRLLARASLLSYSELTQFQKRKTIVYEKNQPPLANLYEKGLSFVAVLLQNFLKTKDIPSFEDIIHAIACDCRNASGNINERVGIFVHVDEHQLFFDAAKSHFGLTFEDACIRHKNFLYPLVTVSFNNICEKENVFLFPFFTGTNHYVLKELTKSTRLQKLHIPLNGLSSKSSRHVIKSLFAEENLTIHESWLKSEKPDSLAPIDVYSAELMGVPRYLWNSELSLDTLPKYVCHPYSRNKLRELLAEIPSFPLDEECYNVPLSCYLAACTGICLTPKELFYLNHSLITSFSVLESEKGRFSKIENARIRIPPIILKGISGLPSSLADMLQLNKIDTDFSKRWETLVAERIGMVLEIRRYLGVQTSDKAYLKFTLNDVLGPNFEDFTASDKPSLFSAQLSLPPHDYKDSPAVAYFEKEFFTNVNPGIQYVSSTMDELLANETKAANIFNNRIIAHLSASKSGKNAIADCVLFAELSAGLEYLTAMISVKGPQFEVGSKGSKRLENLLETVERDLELVSQLPGSRCLVYVLSNFQNAESISRFKNEVMKIKMLNNALADVGVAVVHDIASFLPCIAHRLTYFNDVSERSLTMDEFQENITQNIL